MRRRRCARARHPRRCARLLLAGDTEATQRREISRAASEQVLCKRMRNGAPLRLPLAPMCSVFRNVERPICRVLAGGQASNDAMRRVRADRKPRLHVRTHRDNFCAELELTLAALFQKGIQDFEVFCSGVCLCERFHIFLAKYPLKCLLITV